MSDLDLDADRLIVDQSLHIERGKLRRGDTKTTKSRRSFSLPAPVVYALRIHWKRQLEDQLAARTWTDSGLVFCNEVGGPMDPANLRRTFRGATEKAGLGRGTPNELRHSAASLMSAAGVPLEEIADVLGHSSTRMLEQHYRHAVKPAIDAHVGAMERMFGAGHWSNGWSNPARTDPDGLKPIYTPDQELSI